MLQTIQRYTQMVHFALTAEGSKVLSQVSRKASEMLSASQRTSQTQSEILRAIVALPDHTEIMAELEKFHLHLYAHQRRQESEDEDEDFLRQISTLDFAATQKESYSKRYAHTGQWLLESPDFQTWLNSEAGQHPVLWYPGNPGVGKTVITSIAVNHITENTGGRRNAIVYIYCDYTNTQTFSVENLLGSIVRQLVVQTSDPGTVADLKTFVKKTTKSRNMTEEDLSSWTKAVSSNFDVVYLFVDALDECPEISRDRLLTRLEQFSSRNMRVFLSSRLNVDVTVKIRHATRVELKATSDDITTYVESKICGSSRLASFTAKDPELKQHIVHRIVSQADGMFLLPGLQIEDLSNQTSIRGVRLALERLPTDLFAMYDRTIARIRDQSQENAELGLIVLSTIFGATRPLEIDELRHALAIQPDDTDFDFDDLIDLDVLLGTTAGLVITYQDDDHEQDLFRLVHYTLQEYFEANHKRLFPNSDLDMAKMCLSYLSLNEFGIGQCATDELFWKRRDTFYFFHYAAHNWPHHLRGVQTELMDQSLTFVQDSTKTSAWLQSFEYQECCDIGLSSDEDLPLDPVFLAAHFHLSELFTRLTSSWGVDLGTRNNRGETPLLRAVDVEPWQKGGEYPFLDCRKVSPSRESENWALLQSLDVDQHALVQLLLDRNADIEAKDPDGMTPAFRAVRNENVGILPLLFDRGADIRARRESGESLLQVAVKHERRVDIVQFLLDRGADVKVLTRKGESLVHIAADHPTSAMLDCLIDYGAPFDVTDKEGVTPLLFAAGRGRLETLTALMKRGARLDVTDYWGKTPLHFAVSPEFPPRPDVVEVVMPTQKVNAIDIAGRTSLHHSYHTSARISSSGFQVFQETRIADVIQRLIEGGASETIADAYGRIPKDYAALFTWKHYDQWKAAYRRLMHAPAEGCWHSNPNKSEKNSEDDEERGEQQGESDQLDGHTT